MMVRRSRAVLLFRLALIALFCAPLWYGGAGHARAATGQIFLPNVTKTFGGADGWTTPVAIQNIGTAPTTATVTAYRFKDGASVATIAAPSLQPGQAWLLNPLVYPELPNDTQFSLVVQAASGQVSATVIEGQGASWMAYSGATIGVSKVYLPNITRRLGGVGGWDTPFVVQNIGTKAATISVSFFNFGDGALAKKLDNIALEPGRARDFVPWTIDGLSDDRQYAVVVEGGADAQLYAIVNEVQGTAAMSYEGILSGAQTVYLPNIVKFFAGQAHWSSPFIIQNVGSVAATFSISFYSFSTQAAVAQLENITLQPGRSFADDVRFTPANLPPGQYSVVIRGAPGAELAAVVNQVEFTSGMALSYDGITNAAQSSYLPYIQKDNGSVAWNSPIIAQNLGGAPSDITVTIFDASGVVATQRVFPGIAPGAAVVFESKLDRRVSNGVFSALVQSALPVAAVANHYSDRPGDYGMAFTGTPGPAIAVPALPPLTRTVGGYTFTLSLTPGADIYVENGINAADTGTIVNAVNQEIGSVQTDLGRRPITPPASIYVFASDASFQGGLQSVLGLTAAEATTAFQNESSFFAHRTGLIGLPWNQVKASLNPPATLSRSLRHELTHALLRQLTAASAALPAWLDDGLAVLEEQGAPQSQWLGVVSRYSAASMADANKLFSLADLTSRTSWNARTGLPASFQYRQAAETARLLRTDIGIAGVNKILDLLAQGKSFDDAYAATAAGSLFSQFAAGLPARLNALAPSYPGMAYAQDQAEGAPGLYVILYGFGDGTDVTVAMVHENGQSYTVDGTTTAYGTFRTWLPFNAPSGRYGISAEYMSTSGLATISIVATKP